MITVSNVTLRFGHDTLFENVNLKFTDGNCYGIVGANGAGKSTFLKLLNGTLETLHTEKLLFLKMKEFQHLNKIIINMMIIR